MANHCTDNGHNFQVVPDADTRKTNKDGDTEIYRVFVCTKCGGTIERKVATWAKR